MSTTGRLLSVKVWEYAKHLRRHMKYENDERKLYLRIFTHGREGIEAEIHDPDLRPSLLVKADSFEAEAQYWIGRHKKGLVISRQDSLVVGILLARRMLDQGMMECTMQRWKKERFAIRHWMVIKILQVNKIKVNTAPVHQFNNDPVW